MVQGPARHPLSHTSQGPCSGILYLLLGYLQSQHSQVRNYYPYCHRLENRSPGVQLPLGRAECTNPGAHESRSPRSSLLSYLDSLRCAQSRLWRGPSSETPPPHFDSCFFSGSGPGKSLAGWTLLPPRGRSAHCRPKPGAAGAWRGRGWSCRGPAALPSLSLFPSPYKTTQDLVGSKNNGPCSSTSCSRGDFSRDVQPAPGLSFPLRRRGIRRAQCHFWKAQNADLGNPPTASGPVLAPRTQSPGAKSGAEFVDCGAGAAIRGAAGSARCPLGSSPRPRALSFAAAPDATAGQRQRRGGARRGTGVEVAPALGWSPLVTRLRREVQGGPKGPCSTAFLG